MECISKNKSWKLVHALLIPLANSCPVSSSKASSASDSTAGLVGFGQLMMLAWGFEDRNI